MSTVANNAVKETVTPKAEDLCSAAVGQIPGLSRRIHLVFGPTQTEENPFPEGDKAFRVNFANSDHDIIKSAYVTVKDGKAEVVWERGIQPKKD